MRDVVELSSHIMQKLWPRKAILRLDLRAEMTKDDHSRHLRSHQNRSDQQLEMLQPVRVTRLISAEYTTITADSLWIRRVELQDDQIRLIWHMM